MKKYVVERITIGECNYADSKHIVLCGDKNYIKYCGVTLTSIILSNVDANFTFHIFCDDLSTNDLKKLQNTSDRFGVSLVIYKIDVDIVKRLTKSLNEEKSSISVATFFRIISFEVLGEYIDKVLYLDSDMLVVGDICDLWKTKIFDNYAMVVEDIIGGTHLQNIGVQRYFNAGMIFCNLKKWNTNNLTDFCLEYIYKEKPEWMDQDALNKAFAEKVKFIDNQYNFFANLEIILDESNRPSKSSIAISNENIKIIHFVGRTKPWCHWVQCIPICKKYIQIQNLSMWNDNKLCTVDSINNKQYKYKCARMEMIVSLKEKRLLEIAFWASKYVLYKLQYYVNKK